MSQQFIRGSQISFHYLRMFFQSLRHIFVLSLMMFFICGFAYIFFAANLELFNPILFLKYLECLFYGSLDNSHFITFKAPSGNSFTISTKDYLIWYQKEISPKALFWLKTALFTGIKWFVISFILITALFFYKGKKQKQNRHLRGAKLISISSLSKKIFAFNLKHFHFKPYKLAGVAYPYNAEHQHTLITGGSGTGKTQLMLDLVEQIRSKGDRAIIYDRMGTYIKKFYDPSKDIILNPFDQRSQKWGFFAEGIGRNVFDNMTISLIEESRGDPFWARAARTIVCEAALIMAKKGNLSNKALCDMLLKTPGKEFSNLMKNSNAAAIADDTSEKTVASIRSVVATYIKSLELLEDSEEYFSIRKWMQNPDKQDSILFLSSRIDCHETIKPLLTLWIDLAISELLTNQDNKKTVWFLIDEMPSLQRLPILTTGLAESRQFGGAFIISAQLISQIREIYGRDGSQTISGLCRNRATFSTPDEETAVWCSNNLGKKEILNTKENISFGASDLRDGVNIYQNKETESLVIPSEIMNLGNLELYIKFSNNFPIAKTKLKYQERLDVAKKFIAIDPPELNHLETDSNSDQEDSVQEAIIEDDELAEEGEFQEITQDIINKPSNNFL